MDDEILFRLEMMEACKPSFKYVAGFESFDKDWHKADNGILMVGMVQFFKICDFQDEIMKVILAAKDEFFNKKKYGCHSEATDTRVKGFVDGFLSNTPADCQDFLDKAYTIVKKLVYVYYPVKLGSYKPREHVPINNLTLANIVRKYLPKVTDADILRYSE